MSFNGPSQFVVIISLDKMWRNSPSPSGYSWNSSRESSRSPDNLYRKDHHEHLKIGDRVIVRSMVGDSKTGVLRYVGNVEFAQGLWGGVELFYPLGKNDGTVLGVEYFCCKHPYGIFVPLKMIDWSPVNAMGVKSHLTDEEHNHVYGDKCEIHDKVYWNTEAVMGNKVMGVRNPRL